VSRYPTQPADGPVGDPDHVGEQLERRPRRDHEGVDELPVHLVGAVSHASLLSDVRIRPDSAESWSLIPLPGTPAPAPART